MKEVFSTFVIYHNLHYVTILNYFSMNTKIVSFFYDSFANDENKRVHSFTAYDDSLTLKFSDLDGSNFTRVCVNVVELPYGTSYIITTYSNGKYNVVFSPETIWDKELKKFVHINI